MPLGLRLWLLLWIAGCAEQALVVQESDWQTVPAAQRAALDRQYEADLAAARKEVAFATASLAELPKAPAPARAAPRPSAPGPASDDPWQTAMHDHERARVDARARVEGAQVEVQRTDAIWRQLRADTATARLDVLVAQREVIRAAAVNRNLPGDDTYDSAPMRGQFSRAQQRWYAASTRARAARDAFEHATADLASAKEAYAQIMRSGPGGVLTQLPGEDHAAHLELSGWTELSRDFRRRHGLRRFLQQSRPAQLRKITYQPSRALRSSPSALATSPAPAAPHSSPGAPPTADRTAAPPTTDRTAAPPPTTASGKRPAAPSVPAAEHPADRAAAATPPAASSKPAAPPAPKPAASPFDSPGPAITAGKPPTGAPPATAASKLAASPPATTRGKPAAPSPFDPRWSLDASSTTTAGKPAAAPATAAPGKPATASPFDPRWSFDTPSTTAAAGKPAAADHPADRAAAAKPEAARAAPAPKPQRTAPAATGSTSAAKPVEHPDPDAHPH
ncbi:MAG TPA: hypothetical protein VHT91_31610 [Kofleriaceae bacterium]|jgi:hypothetical protein|nr:hypothetical protein [Kofleriaceae bacterium]